jgi:uncharacterized membrane protein
MSYIDILARFFGFSGVMIEYIGLLFIVIFLVTSFIRLAMKKYTMEHVRMHLAKKIMFGLEIIIAGDILLATVATDMADIMRLGGIVLIRVVLGYALRKEVLAR